MATEPRVNGGSEATLAGCLAMWNAAEGFYPHATLQGGHSCQVILL